MSIFMSSQINFDFIGFPNASEDREKFNRIVNQCINVELKELYELEGYSSIEYCTQNEAIVKLGKSGFLSLNLNDFLLFMLIP